jgi:hypothetical protein
MAAAASSANATSAQSSPAPQSAFYVVRVGHQRGIFNTYTEIQPFIKDFAKPQFRKFDNRKDAELFLNFQLDPEETLITASNDPIKPADKVIIEEKSSPNQAIPELTSPPSISAPPALATELIAFLSTKFPHAHLYNSELDHLEPRSAAELEEMKNLFSKIEPAGITGCWGYRVEKQIPSTNAAATGSSSSNKKPARNIDQDFYRTVAEWKYANTKKDLFSFPSMQWPLDKEYINQTYIVRHHPFRCELMRDFIDSEGKLEHIRCCRPSHLCYSTRTQNNVDSRTVKYLQTNKQFLEISARFCAELDELMSNLLIESSNKEPISNSVSSESAASPSSGTSKKKAVKKRGKPEDSGVSRSCTVEITETTVSTNNDHVVAQGKAIALQFNQEGSESD